MASNRMTVSDLVSREKDIRNIVDRLDRLNAVMQTDPEIHDRTARAIQDRYGDADEPIYLLNGARNSLSEYADLLKKIMQQTAVPWPPSVDMGAAK